MDLRPYYLRKVCISEPAQLASKELVLKIKNCEIEMDLLPNSYENFTGHLEVEDFLSFCRFLESRRGKRVLELLEVNQ